MQLSVVVLQVSQLITSLLVFLFPALFAAYLMSHSSMSFLSIKTKVDMRILVIVLLMTLMLTPTVSLTGYFNAQMKLPESLAGIETWIKSTEEAANMLIERIVSENGVWAFILNIFVIAVAAGVTEEFMFRGALLKIMREKIKNHHVAIWVVAVIFSFIHFQFYGFLPRMLLGAFLGYLVYWTNNIWIPVSAHLFHNAVAFAGMSNASLKDNAIFAEEVAPDDIKWLTITALVCLMLFFYGASVVRKMGR
jgi:membrane protease YdiL (CAAX protease family)